MRVVAATGMHLAFEQLQHALVGAVADAVEAVARGRRCAAAAASKSPFFTCDDAMRQVGGGDVVVQAMLAGGLQRARCRWSSASS